MKNSRNQSVAYIFEERVGEFTLFEAEAEAEKKENKKYFIRGLISVFLVSVITSINFI